MRELAKHTSWKIDHSPTYIPEFSQYRSLKEFTASEMERAFARLCQYDIIFSSYHPDPTAYTMLKVARDRAGTQFVLDCDDNMFAINPDNPFWTKINDEQVYWMQRMIADNDWICTPTHNLADVFRKRRPGKLKNSVTVIPNYVADDYHHPKFNNSPDVVIGYMGGSSHYADLHESGVLEAVQKLMHENKKVRFKSVGMLVDTYIPRGRFTFDGGKRGQAFLSEVFPSLKFDIGLGPLLDNPFNRGKSNIKWQEMTRAGAVFVASAVGPYKASVPVGGSVLVANETNQWYTALKWLVDNPKERAERLKVSQGVLSQSWRLEDHWQAYERLFKRVYKAKDAHYNKAVPKVKV
jgi:hypothetical protein